MQSSILYALPGGLWVDREAQQFGAIPLVATVLTSITVAPSATSISALTSTTFTATGNYSDGSTADLTASASWSSSNSAIAISGTPANTFTGLTPGLAIITASFGAFSGTSNLTVTAAVSYGTRGYYPKTATALRFATGYGTWTAGYLLNDTASPAVPSFGPVNLSTSLDSPTFHQPGPLGGTDYAVSMNGTDQLSTGSTTLYDVPATSDLAVLVVAKFSDTTSFDTICSKGATSDPNLFILWKNANTLNIRSQTGFAAYSISVPFTRANEWVAILGVRDAATGRVRIGWRSLSTSGASELSANTSVPSGSLSNASPFYLGCAPSYGGLGSTTLYSCLYVATGVGAAAGLAANMDSALSRFVNALFPNLATTYTTGDVIRSNNGNLVWVAAIEGYPYLLTSHSDPRQVVAAWNYGDASDWQLALPNLQVQLDRNHVLNPWVPFDKGSDFQLKVTPEQFPIYGQIADQFGVDVAKRTAGAQTQLTATADRAATTLAVKQTTSFPSSGEIYVGTECMDATVGTSTSFTVTNRGKYSPFKTAQATNFAEHHRVGNDALGVELEPVVSQYPRDWAGKWVGIWLHWSDGTRINPLSTATCVYAGKWQSYSDDGTATTVNVKSMLDGVANTVLGRDMWSAKVQAGHQINVNDRVSFRDNDYNGVWKTANDLVVVASGATGSNQINAGIWTIDDLATAINTWLSAEKVAGRIFGYYFLNPAENYSANGGTDIRSMWHWFIPSTAAYGQFEVVSWSWGQIFGGFGQSFNVTPDISNAWHTGGNAVSPGHPQGAPLFTYIYGQLGVTCQVEQASGHFVDNYALLPASIKNVLTAGGGGLQWGCFMFNETTMYVGSFTDGATTINNLQPVDAAILGTLEDVNALVNTTLDASAPLPPIRQVFLMEDALGDFLQKLAYSTGTPNHNASAASGLDSLGYGLGLGLPGGMLGAAFIDSCNGMPGADTSRMIRIDKPTKFSDLMEGDLVFLRSFPKWKGGGLQIGSWYTPTADQAIATLDESNKAEPAGNNSPHSAVTTEDTTYTKNIIKVFYNRDFSADENYQAVLILEDRTAVDDAGGEGSTVEIKARNTYGSFQQTGTAIEALWPGFMGSAQMFTRPTSKVVRSANLTLFEDLSIGDTVLFSDKTARDPATGQRAVLLRPALITRHHVNYGGPGVPQVGEIELFFMPSDRIASYAPSATVDSTINGGVWSHGYNSTTHQIQCVPYDFAETYSPVDAARFNVGDDVRLTEIDPADPANPLTWVLSITAISGDIITFNTALTSPAWDGTKKYQLTYDHFGADQTTQQLKTFQSSSVTGLLESSGSPYQYGIQGNPSSFTVNTGSELAELYAQISYGDGKPRDVGADRGIIRTLNNLIDYRTAKQGGWLCNTVLENTTYSTGGGYQLAFLKPFFIGSETYPVTIQRKLRIAPFFRSSTGASANLRVTISPYPTSSTSKNDVSFYTPNTSVVFTTSSTTWATATEQDIPLTFRPSDGIIWIHVELGIHCQTRGLGLCKESQRIF